MQLETMDCTARTNNTGRDSDLGEDMSHGDHSDDDMRDCDSMDGEQQHMSRTTPLNPNVTSNGGSADMSYAGRNGGVRLHSPSSRSADMQMSHHHQFPPNHALSALGNFMGIGGLHGLPNLQHNDVLEKLKMQVRDMKVGLMEQDYAAAHAAAFGSNMLPSAMNPAFSLPPSTIASFEHRAQNMSASQVAGNGHSGSNGSLSAQNSMNATSAALTNGSSGGGSGAGGGGGGGVGEFPFTSPSVPSTKDVNPASNSSTSSEASNSSQPNNSWSFEEQYKQVRQLYEINDDPKRKEFLDDLFAFMQKRGSPINRLPIMAKSVLDLYELYNLVIARGGLVDVINKKLWQEIIKGLHLPSSITSAAFTLRTQYMKYLYPYECEKQNLSTPAELQTAIDGNRREGRRSSYGQYEAMHNQLNLPPINRSALPGSMQQITPLALVTHANNQQAAQVQAAAAVVAHQRLMNNNFGQPQTNLLKQEIESRMMDYLKIVNEKSAIASLQQQQLQQQQQQSQAHTSNKGAREALNALEMSRMAIWQMCQQGGMDPTESKLQHEALAAALSGEVPANGLGESGGEESQRSEALNLTDSPTLHLAGIKREAGIDSFQHHAPPHKRSLSGLNFPTGFYLPHGVAAAAAAAAANMHQHNTGYADGDCEDELDDETEALDNGAANRSLPDDGVLQQEQQPQQLNGHHFDMQHRNAHSRHSHSHYKSDDSALENSPSTSATSAASAATAAANERVSPVTTKKQPPSNDTVENGSCDGRSASAMSHLNPLEPLNMLSGLQFRVEHNGTSATGEQQLIVQLDLNGIKYSGTLLAQVDADMKTPMVSPIAATSTPALTSSKETTPTSAPKDELLEDGKEADGEGPSTSYGRSLRIPPKKISKPGVSNTTTTTSTITNGGA